MTPESILAHTDSGRLWPSAPSLDTSYTLAQAYQDALRVRALRLARGETPRGFKVGFTNRNIWQRYNVSAPIWGTVYETTLTQSGGRGNVALAHTCQPRIEPELVFGFGATPKERASFDELYAALEWVAPGFEIVQSHLPDWKFSAADTVADGGLHAHLLVGQKLSVTQIASSAAQLDAVLANTKVRLFTHDRFMEEGWGSNVLGSPLQALYHFLEELRACPGALDLKSGDFVTTGTWTDAWPVAAGEVWIAEFAEPFSKLEIRFD